MKATITFYPVGNGDTSQIVLDNKRRILMDYRHQMAGEDPSIPAIDLNARLQLELKEAGRDYFDVVAFTHADEDHISGSTEFFELQYAQKYQGGDRIKIRQLWVPAAMLLEKADNGQQKEEFVVLRQEARHRLLEGKGILVFSKPAALMEWLKPKLKERGEPETARDHLFVDAGKVAPGFSRNQDGVEFFCHSPFIKHCDEGDIIRNDAALIFNVRFDTGGSCYDYLAVGDATWEVLEDIVKTTHAHGNADRLAWDLFNIPHHCSYLALSDEKGSLETEPKPLVKDLLLKGKRGAYAVSSSSPITDDREGRESVQPPHIQARKAYVKHLNLVGGRKFLVTMEEPNASKPEPLVFDVTAGGISWTKSVAIGAVGLAASRPARAG